jgi:hypothetical protein
VIDIPLLVVGSFIGANQWLDAVRLDQQCRIDSDQIYDKRYRRHHPPAAMIFSACEG